jgi:mannitol/fructose-specific phosphotransferase system IIA component (Ntr-type)
MRGDDLVTEAVARFRRRANDMGVVADERGEWIGIITLEDLLEQLIGEIDDEPLGAQEQTEWSVVDALTPGRILLEFDADSIRDAIANVTNAIPEGELPVERRTVIDALSRRSEQMMTNYLGRGVVVPHARLDELEKPVVVFARSVGGFAVADNEHADMLFLVLTPSRMPNAQPHLLADVSRLIGSDYVLDHLKTALTPEGVIETIRVGEQVVPA